MKSDDKTKEQLLKELYLLKAKITGLEKPEIDHKQAEEALREIEENFRDLVENLLDGVAITDENAYHIYVNPKFSEITGYSEDELLSMTGWDFTRPEDITKLKQRMKDRIAGKPVQTHYERIIVRKDGTEVPVEMSTTVVTWRGKKRPMAIIHNITERKRTEDALQESEERFRAQYNGSPTPCFTWRAIGEDFVLVDYNNEAIATINGQSYKYLGKTAKEMYQNRHEIIYDLHRCLTEKTIIKNEFMSKHFMPGKYILTTYAFVPPDLVMVHITDITKRKQAEEEREQLQAQLIQSSKMAGVGSLASGIAHEFNNLLQIMQGHVQFAQTTGKPDDMKDAFDLVVRTSNRASKIIKDLSSYSRHEEGEKELCNIKEPLESVFSLTEDQLKKINISVERKYGRTSQLMVNKGEIQQVFLNMVTNARDAMFHKGGRLEVGIRQEKGHVIVSFHDTGVGIREEDIGRVFDPFFTTKGALGGDENIAGTGLGLSVSYGIVRSHGGTIEVESKRGKGTTFTVSLPAKRGKAK